MELPSLLINNLLNEIRKGKNTPTPAINEENLFVEGNLEKALKIEDLKLRRENYQLAVQNRTERKKYARHIFIVTCVWATLIFLIVIASGFKEVKDGKTVFSFTISDRVMITLITSTTINFFGFFLLVVKYLFHVAPVERPAKTVIVKRRNKAADFPSDP